MHVASDRFSSKVLTERRTDHVYKLAIIIVSKGSNEVGREFWDIGYLWPYSVLIPHVLLETSANHGSRCRAQPRVRRYREETSWRRDSP